MTRVLFLTTAWPGARRSGGEVVSQGFVDALRLRGSRVTTVGYLRPQEVVAVHPDDLVAGTRPIETSAAGPRVATWALRALWRRWPYSAAKYASAAYLAAVAESLPGADVVVVDHAQAAWVLPALPGRAPIVYLAHNVEEDLYAAQRDSRGGISRLVYAREAARIAALERSLCSRAERVWTLASEDTDAFRRRGAHHVETFAVPAATVVSSAVPDSDVVLLGKWSWGPNAAGLRWFTDEVVPLLGTEVSVLIGGTGAEAHRGSRPNVTVVDAPARAAEFLVRGRVIAVPARAGGGVQIKTLDALATGRSVVATTLALRGVGSTPPTLRTADDPAAFARELRAAARSPADAGAVAAATAWAQERSRDFERAVPAAISDLLGR